MGSLNIAYPSAGGQSLEQQVAGLKSYLFALADQLNLADWSAGAVLQELDRAISTPETETPETRQQLKDCAALKSLVIKTADYAAANSQQLQFQLKSDYVAISDFGEYWQNATMTVNGTSFGIKQLFQYAEGINNHYNVKSQQYIKTGLLYYEETGPVYGVGVGHIKTSVTDSKGEVIDWDCKENQLLTVTSDRISFWQGGMEVGYISEQKLHLPAAKITGGTLDIGKLPKAKETDEDKYNFTVDNTGNVICRNLTVTGGKLDIGGNFSVTEKGHLTASNVNITEGELNIGETGETGENGESIYNFTVENTGEVTCRNLTVTGGKLDIGGKFSVTDEGHLTASSVDITGGKLNIGGNFTVKNTGEVTCENLVANGGTIGGCKIVNGQLKVTSLWANESGNIRSNMTNEGLEVMSYDDNGTKNTKIFLGVEGSNSAWPLLRLGANNPHGYVMKYFTGNCHYMWIGNFIDGTGIKIDMTSGTITLYGNGSILEQWPK